MRVSNAHKYDTLMTLIISKGPHRHRNTHKKLYSIFSRWLHARSTARWGNVGAEISWNYRIPMRAHTYIRNNFTLKANGGKFGMWKNSLINLSEFPHCSLHTLCVCSSWTWIFMVRIKAKCMLCTSGMNKARGGVCVYARSVILFYSSRSVTRLPIHSFRIEQWFGRETFDFIAIPVSFSLI